MIRRPPGELKRLKCGYAAFKRLVSRQVYADVAEWQRQKEDAEKDWPAEEGTEELIRPEQYLKQTDAEVQRTLEGPQELSPESERGGASRWWLR
eukprot:66553-Pyramimonas_sp.AAC.1